MRLFEEIIAAARCSSGRVLVQGVAVVSVVNGVFGVSGQVCRA
ncbi:hypothetical protein [Prosthecochloris sp.]|nr:hypothetical protein [Prosthecochloris sp.]